MGVSTNTTVQLVAADGCRTAEAAGEAVGLVAEAGDGVVCDLCRARTTRKRGKCRRALGVILLALFYFWGCAHVRKGLGI